MSACSDGCSMSGWPGSNCVIMRQIFNDYVDIINPDISVDEAPESKCTVVTSNICVIECASTAVWEHMATYACALEVQNHIFQHAPVMLQLQNHSWICTWMRFGLFCISKCLHVYHDSWLLSLGPNPQVTLARTPQSVLCICPTSRMPAARFLISSSLLSKSRHSSSFFLLSNSSSSIFAMSSSFSVVVLKTWFQAAILRSRWYCASLTCAS